MKFFKDKADTKWLLDLTFGAVMRIKAASDGKFNLLEPGQANGTAPLQGILWERLDELFELLWHIVEPQATEKGITAAQFGELMAADCIVSARAAFFDEWTDFFRRLQRMEVAAALEKTTLYQAKLLELVQARLKDPKMADLDQRVEAKMSSVLNKSFCNLQDSLDSILSDSPGAN